MASSVDPDEAARYKPPHLDIHCLQICKFIFSDLPGRKGEYGTTVDFRYLKWEWTWKFGLR